ncbi:MAG: enoyl-CoA hydratase/isomerase family protein [Betaproteobacteria bacterium]
MTTWNTLRVENPEPYIVSIVLNRPETRNAISLELARELDACFASLKGDPKVRVLLFTGEGTAFGSGADLKERGRLTPDQTRGHRESVLRVIETMETFPIPIVAMINGPAIAGGFELALGCDIRVASDKATFALSEVRNVGSFPGAGGPIRLAKLVGRGRANLVVLTARKFSAQEAFDLGLIEMVVPHAELREATLGVAREIAGNSPTGVAAAKKLIRQSNDLDVYAATELSRALRDPLDKSADYAEGLHAWLEKRTPAFTGR